MARNSGLLKFDSTGTINMGLNYPCSVIEAFPGDSFRLEMKALLRFLPQVSPTMSNVVATVDTYTVPLRQLCEKLGISWDDLLTGGEDGNTDVPIPTITIPDTGYEPGSLADWLGYPTNYLDVDTNEKVIVGAGLKLTAWPVIAYMHIINENYRDQNFIKKFDLKKYQEFLDGKYAFETPQGEPIEYDLCVKGVFPKAWTRDYFGRALPNTQRGPSATLPIGGSADLQPSVVAVKGPSKIATFNGLPAFGFQGGKIAKTLDGTSSCYVVGLPESSPMPSGYELLMSNQNVLTPFDVQLSVVPSMGDTDFENVTALLYLNGVPGDNKVYYQYRFNYRGKYYVVPFEGNVCVTSSYTVREVSSYVDLSDVKSDLSNATAASIIAFRLAARMQRFGEILQTAGARAVEYTMAMFGVRIPDERVQRPIFHGSFRMPVVFSEVLQTSSTDSTSPQGNLAGHGITGGVNKPIHIKVIEHSFVISILNVMPRSQYRDFIPAHLLRFNRMDIPVPMMQGIGDQPVKRVQIFPNSKNPNEAFGFIPQYSDLWYIPSGLHGHMKDTFLHWNMARVYKTEPVLSAAWRYEKPTDRSFAVKDEDQMQIQIGFTLRARRPFAKNKQPGIHIV